MQSIETKYLGPSNFKGARITAVSANGNRLIISYPHECDGEQAHAQAALALARKLGWTGTLIAGSTRTGYVFVWAAGDRYTA